MKNSLESTPDTRQPRWTRARSKVLRLFPFVSDVKVPILHLYASLVLLHVLRVLFWIPSLCTVLFTFSPENLWNSAWPTFFSVSRTICDCPNCPDNTWPPNQSALAKCYCIQNDQFYLKTSSLICNREWPSKTEQICTTDTPRCYPPAVIQF